MLAIKVLAKRIFLTACCFALALTWDARAETVVPSQRADPRGRANTTRERRRVQGGYRSHSRPVVASVARTAAGGGLERDSRCHAYGPACIQNPLGTGVFLAPLAKLYGHDYPLQKIDMSEDCLYLNVWTTEWPAKHAAPVMFWIHGGSNIMGSGAESSYDGTALAAKGVVVVTMNYRLGIFGSFSHPQLTQESPHHASGTTDCSTRSRRSSGSTRTSRNLAAIPLA